MTLKRAATANTLLGAEAPSRYLVAPYDSTIEAQLELGREFLAEYRETFRALAK